MISLEGMPPLNVIPSEEEFGQRLLAEFDRAKRYYRQFSIAMIEGEESGSEDDRRRQLDLLGTGVRSSDLVGQVAPGCFAILLVETNIETGRQAAEQILLRCMEHSGENGNWSPDHLRIGVAAYEDCSDSLRAILERAEAALQIARERGGAHVAGMWGSGSATLSDLHGYAA